VIAISSLCLCVVTETKHRAGVGATWGMREACEATAKDCTITNKLYLEEQTIWCTLGIEGGVERERR
jgi:hypothetical protein